MFARTIKLLLDYFLAEGIEGLSSYATHPVVQEWAWQIQEDMQSEYSWLVAVIIGSAVPHESEKESGLSSDGFYLTRTVAEGAA